MEKTLFKKLEHELFKSFITELIIKFRENHTRDELNEFKNYILKSGITEAYNKLVFHLKPVIYNGLSELNIKAINDDIIKQANNFIEKEYPVYKDWKENLINQYIRNLTEIAKAFKNDKEEVEEMIEVKNISIKSIKTGLGDIHRGGKSVSLVELSNGKKILYKPRSLSFDIHFKDLLEKIDFQLNIGLYSPKVISRKDYGWVEYIEYKECKNYDELKDYYKRIGALMGILYVLEATDFHYENVIAHGSFPVLIDLESFFHPYKPIEGTETNQGIDHTVLRTGLLPAEIILKNNQRIEASGLSDMEGVESLTARNKRYFTKGNTIEIKKEKAKLRGGKNIPGLNGNKILVNEKYALDIANGFEIMYSFILQKKEWFKKQIKKFSYDSVRVLFRNTVVYSHILEESTNPQIMKAHENLNELFENLKRVIPDYKLAEHFVEYEIKDLMNRDMPQFTTKVNSKDLFFKKDEYIKDFFKTTGYKTVINKINSLSKSDLQQQLWIIKKTIERKTISESKKPIQKSNKTITKSNRNKALKEIVEEIKTYIIKNINTENPKNINWLVLRSEDLSGQTFVFSQASYDLYSGMPGEILFLSQYGKLFNDKEALAIAEKAYNFLQKLLKKTKESIRPIGLYTGWGSIIFLNNELYKIHKNSYYLEQNTMLFKSLNFEELIKKDANYGLIKGSAGFITACCKFYELKQDKKVLNLALKAADHLINNQYKDKNGIGWRIASEKPLSGMGHGASGFILAFLNLYIISGNNKYLKIIGDIISYENSLFSEEHKNWKDIRKFVLKRNPGKTICSTAWSHGAGGIGLARLELIKNDILTDITQNDLQIAVDTTIKTGFNKSNNLIFGNFGNLELLINYLEIFDDKKTEKEYNRILNILLSDIQKNGWHISDHNLNSLGLMAGVTGLGYQCLRILYPKKISSVLAC